MSQVHLDKFEIKLDGKVNFEFHFYGCSIIHLNSRPCSGAGLCFASSVCKDIIYAVPHHTSITSSASLHHRDTPLPSTLTTACAPSPSPDPRVSSSARSTTATHGNTCSSRLPRRLVPIRTERVQSLRPTRQFHQRRQWTGMPTTRTGRVRVSTIPVALRKIRSIITA